MSSKGNKSKGAKAAPKSVVGKRKGEPDAEKSAALETAAIAMPEAEAEPTRAVESAAVEVTPVATAEATSATGTDGKTEAGTTETAVAPEIQEPGDGTPEKPARESWKGKSLDDLRALFRETLGRECTSESRAYIAWAVSQARKGKKRIGPPRPKREAGTLQVIPLTMAREYVAALDAAWRRIGIKSRTECIRRALHSYLDSAGEVEVAGMFADAE